MKKVILILNFVGLLLTINAQSDDNNPYRYNEWKAATEQAYTEVRQEFLSKECDILLLQTFREKYSTSQDIQYLHAIKENCNCPEVIDYAVDLITNSSDEETRKIAIGILGFRKHYDAIPLLLNQAKKDISSNEKIAIAATLAILGKKTEALEFLNCNCYVMNDMDNTCVYAYFHLFDQSTAIEYFDYYFDKPETQLEAACWLAKLGVSDKTFPLFVDFLKTNTTYERATSFSLVGLAAIGTEEALEIIKDVAKKDKSLISDTATRILDRIMNERREK